MKVLIHKVDRTIPKNEAMEFCVRISSEIWEGSVDGKLACVWGVILPTLLSDQVYLWMYSNELVDQHQFVFVRHSQRVCEELLKRYQAIVGHVRADAPRSIRWLKWLGAELGQLDGIKIPFRIRKKDG